MPHALDDWRPDQSLIDERWREVAGEQARLRRLDAAEQFWGSAAGTTDDQTLELVALREALISVHLNVTELRSLYTVMLHHDLNPASGTRAAGPRVPDNVRRRQREARRKLRRFMRVKLDEIKSGSGALGAVVRDVRKKKAANWRGLLFYEEGFKKQLRDPEPYARRRVDGHALAQIRGPLGELRRVARTIWEDVPGDEEGSAEPSGVGAASGAGRDEADGGD